MGDFLSSYAKSVIDPTFQQQRESNGRSDPPLRKRGATERRSANFVISGVKKALRRPGRLFAPFIRKRKQPIISFIIPVYNKEKYLGKCLASIQRQTIADYEVICVDDSSSDTSSEILSTWTTDDRITVVRHDANRGPGAARNTGLRLACGTYVRFVDADDVVPASSSEQLLAAAKQSGSRLVRGNLEQISTNTKWRLLLAPVGDCGIVDFSQHDSLRVPWYFFAYMVERTVAFNCQFPDLRTGEDAVFLARALCQSPNVHTISKIVYHYRKRKGRVEHVPVSRRHIEDYLKHAHLVREAYLSHNYEASWEAYKAVFLSSAMQLLCKSSLPIEQLRDIKNELLQMA